MCRKTLSQILKSVWCAYNGGKKLYQVSCFQIGDVNDTHIACLYKYTFVLKASVKAFDSDISQRGFPVLENSFIGVKVYIKFLNDGFNLTKFKTCFTERLANQLINHASTIGLYIVLDGKAISAINHSQCGIALIKSSSL